MSGYKDLEIYKKAFALSIRTHRASMKLPSFELYEMGSQVRRSTMSAKDQIVEGYGRRRYKADFIKFLTYSQASCDEATSQLESIIELYPDLDEFSDLLIEYDELGKQIFNFILYVEKSWKTTRNA